jgi:hypothetical protein
LFLGTIVENNIDRTQKGRTWCGAGSARYNAKLTDERVLFLRRLPKLSLKLAKQLAAEWGVCWRHLYKARAGTRWLIGQ